MSYIGKIGASRISENLLIDLQRAESSHKSGLPMKAIKLDTGWELGVDGLWRYELADPFKDTSSIENYIKPRFGEPINIRMLLSDQTIFSGYPEFEDLILYAMYSPQRGTAGYYNPVTKGMVVSMGAPSDDFEYQIEGVLLHEIQHLIQEIEGFARGGDPKRFGRRIYKRLAGEVEARNICHRHSLSIDKRRNTLRTDTQDVLDNNQIIIFR